jgi:energy-coupling factor transport system permease protein
MSSATTTKNGPSFMAQLDPRVKFATLILIAYQVFVLTYISALVGAGGTLVTGFLLSKIRVSLVLKRLFSISVFILLIVGINMFNVDGNVMFEVMGLYATQEGMWLGITLALRIILLLLAATIFVQTTSVTAMIDGTEAILRPVRKHTGAMIQVLTISLNFVPMLIQSAQQIKKAQIARGADPDRNIFRQIQFASSAAVPLFAMALRASERLASSMDARGYDFRAERSQYSILRLAFRDVVAISFVVAQFALSVFLHR